MPAVEIFSNTYFGQYYPSSGGTTTSTSTTTTTSTSTTTTSTSTSSSTTTSTTTSTSTTTTSTSTSTTTTTSTSTTTTSTSTTTTSTSTTTTSTSTTTFPPAETVFLVSKEGKNVLERLNPNDYIINSRYNTFKIYKEFNGFITTPAAPGTGQKIIAHGLGYHPAFLAYYRLKKNSQVWWLDQTSMNSNTSDNDGYRSQGTQINKSEIRLSVRDGESVGASDIEFKAFILVDPISLVPPNITGVPLSQNIGFKASKPGINVLNAKAHELVLSSKYDSLKFHMDRMVSFTIPALGTSGSASFEHGLGYVPMFLGVIQDYNDSTKQRLTPFGRVPQAVAASVKCDRSTITAAAVSAGGPSDMTFTFRLIVFKNKLSDA